MVTLGFLGAATGAGAEGRGVSFSILNPSSQTPHHLELQREETSPLSVPPSMPSRLPLLISECGLPLRAQQPHHSCAHQRGTPPYKAFFHPLPGPASLSAELDTAEARCRPLSMASVSWQLVAEPPTAPTHVSDRAPFKGCVLSSGSAPPPCTEESHKVGFSSTEKKGGSSPSLPFCFPAVHLNVATEGDYESCETDPVHDLRGHPGGQNSLPWPFLLSGGRGHL